MRKIIFMLCLLASFYSYAEVPNYQVFPQLGTLAVNYHVEAKNKQTVIYATNHEKFSIICDAEMTTSKQEKIKGHETLLEPKKTAAFSFSHRSSITDVRIYLMCEASEQGNSGTGQEDPSDQQPEKAPLIIEEDLEAL